MFNLKSIVKSAVVSAIALSFGTTAFAGGHSKVLRIQSVLPTTGDEIKMVKEFGKDQKNIESIQKAFNHRAKMNGLSSKGEWSENLEKPVSYTHLTLPTILLV